MNRHRSRDNRTAWIKLRDAGLVLIVVMGIALMAIAVAVGFLVGSRIA